MTSEHLKSIFSMYLLQWGKSYPAQKQDTAVLDSKDRSRVLQHTMWMCEQGIKFLEEPKDPASDYILAARLKAEASRQAKIEKAMRWLGFVQGMLFCICHYTIDDLRAHSTQAFEG